MPPKFLYKVVHKIGCLRKFNRSREIEFNFLTAWTMSMKFGTLVQRAPGYKSTLLAPGFVDQPFFFHSAKTVSIAINKKVKFDGARCLFSTFFRLQGDHHCACAQKWCHFSFFSKSFQTKKRIKALRPKMTK